MPASVVKGTVMQEPTKLWYKERVDIGDQLEMDLPSAQKLSVKTVEDSR